MQLSFEYSFNRLGGTCLGFSSAEETRSGSSYSESISDTARVISEYCDICVARFSSSNQMIEFSNASIVPIISAGHGAREHPTQALVDLFTIDKHLDEDKEKSILISGNPQERTINSFILGLNLYDKINIHILCPKEIPPSPFLINHLNKNRISYDIHHTYDQLRRRTDTSKINAIYQEVLNNEHTSAEIENPEEYYLTSKRISLFSKDVKILHPLPRKQELPPSLDSYSGSLYFSQVSNAKYVRAALLIYLFKYR